MTRIQITRIRISNGEQATLLTGTRTIYKRDLAKYRRRLMRLYHGEVDFTTKELIK